MDYRIKPARLQQRLEEFSAIGRDPEGGITRPFGSDADTAARKVFRNCVNEAGLTYRVDAAGNQWAILPGDPHTRLIAAGSHLDTVPHGGAFDGIAGVLLAMEAVQTIPRLGYRNRHPLAVVAFTGEEPNAFGLSTLGSRLYTGRLHGASLLSCRTAEGLSLQEALQRVGGDLTRCDTLDFREMAAFIEPHIEQSARLDAQQAPLAIVDRITGIYRDHVTLVGEQNHAGATALQDRRDALWAFGQAVEAFEALLREPLPSWAVGTIGQVQVYPHAINIVPARVEFVAEIRALDPLQLTSLAQRYRNILTALMAERGIGLHFANVLRQSPESLAPTMRAVLEKQVRAHHLTPITVSSWAGHDATHLARVVPTGMLFIRSLQGKSHCPEEASRPEDLALAAEVLLDAVMELDHAMKEEVTPDVASL